jgi:hypothetical protein
MKEIAEKLFDAVSSGKITTEEYKITVEVIKKIYKK